MEVVSFLIGIGLGFGLCSLYVILLTPKHITVTSNKKVSQRKIHCDKNQAIITIPMDENILEKEVKSIDSIDFKKRMEQFKLRNPMYN
ncbi:hypothetical protein KIM67_17880 [Flagellimonas sp. 389]|uniref:hypothetical protein n=1 Tax=Flagellimonas sp. 389 TaxID=2835862 RepID=UPI001BD6B0B2|nr:hypothetical protein [Flagellimonas sp. 389]MBS9464298.1 hypothetical protein [Flagellimonas sp. 389]